MERKRYNAGRGGHAPGHLREWFEEFIETDEVVEEMTDKGLSANWLLGQLWNCSDIMPGHICSYLDMPVGRTYAQAARLLKQA